MKKVLLETKWLGLLAVIAFAAAIAGFASHQASTFAKEVAPDIAEEARYFLPITIENGRIVEPADTLIRKTYSDEDGSGSFDVVLNTQVDEFRVQDIQTPGLYISRKVVYTVSAEKTQLRSLSSVPDLRFDEDKLDAVLEWIEEKLGVTLFPIIFIGLFFFVSVAILLYSALAHLFVGRRFSAGFARTLRITVWTYLVLTALSWFAYLPGGILAKFVLILLANYFVDKFAYPKISASDPESESTPESAS